MIKVLLTHPGTQHAFRLANGLERKKILYRFYTSFAIVAGSLEYRLLQLLPYALRRKMLSRILYNIPSKKVKRIPSVEIAYMLGSKGDADEESLLFKRNRKFQERIPQSVINSSDVVIGFDTSSWVLAKRTHEAGKKFILDQSIAHPSSKEKVYKKLNEQYPGWSQQLVPKKENLIKLEALEHQLADRIVVASTFTKDTLIENGVDAAKIVVNPYGVDLQKFEQKNYKKNNKVQFIFIGSLTARKGIPFLLEVWKNVDPSKVTLNLVGPCDENIKKILPELPSVNYLGRIPHNELPSLIAENDVFLFPSFFEGFGLVILETMAIGLPVITTNATAGTDMIREGVEGFVIDTFDRSSLMEKINYFIEHPEQIEVMGRNARTRVENFSWEAYDDRWENIISDVSGKK